MTEHISKSEMQALLSKDYVPQTVDQDFDKCCDSIKPCSQDIKKLADGIEDLYR